MIENLIEELRALAASVQITLDLGKSPTVHAFDSDKNLHRTEAYTLERALEMMIFRLSKSE